MKKILKLVSMVGLLNVVMFNNVILTTMKVNKHNNEHSDNADLLKWKLSATDTNLVKTYERKIHKNASSQSINEFNELYDTNKKQAIWKDYASLQYDLTHTKICMHSLDVNWTKMYKNAGLDEKQLQLAQQEQLRFYNIFAKVFHKNNVIRLVQKVAPVAVTDNTVAWTAFNPQTNSQQMGYGPDFVNSKLIDEQYQQGFWSSDKIISVTTHEYGHALSNFIGLNASQRASFNTNWNWPEINYNNLHISTNLASNSQLLIINKSSKQINNRAHYLMDYLAKQANISNENQELLFSLVAVDSNYGRSAWSGTYNANLEDEFFAESFAKWILTPQNHRDWGWELENNFFLHYLPAVL